MCDCYYHKCKECDAKLPVHLGDYDTQRDEIEVFCEDHIPEHDVRAFTVTGVFEDEENNYFENDKTYVGWKMAMRSLTENAIYNEEGNHPNLASKIEIEKRE